MTLIDSHVHVWDLDHFGSTWLSTTGLDRAMLPADVDRANAEPNDMIFIQVTDVDPLAEARWVDQLPWLELIAIVAGADLAQHRQAVEEHLTALAGIPRVVGVRHVLEDTDVSDFAVLSEGLRVLEQRGGTFDACIRHPQLEGLIDLLEAVPNLTVVLDHLGKPPVDDGINSPDGRRWSQLIGVLADRPRTYVKLSGLAVESSDAALFDAHVDAFIDRGLEAFGAHRAMIGSNWPVSRHFGIGERFAAWSDHVRRLVGESAWPVVSGTSARTVYLPGGVSALRPG